MPINPASIAQSFLQSRRAAQQDVLQQRQIEEASQFRGLQMEQMARQMAAQRRQETKAQRLQGLVSSYLQGEQGAAQELMTTPAGREELQATQSMNAQRFQMNALMALSGDDAELEQATPFLRADAIAMGANPQIVDNMANMPVAQRRNALMQQLGIDSAEEDGDWTTFTTADGIFKMNKDTGEIQETGLGAKPSGTPRLILNERNERVGVTLDGTTDAVTGEPIDFDKGETIAAVPQYQAEGVPGVPAEQATQLEAFGNTITRLRELGQDPTNFGAAGLLKGTVQDLVQQGSAMARLLDNEALRAQTESAATDIGIDFEYDKTRPALDTMLELAVYQAAAGIAKQTGRAFSESERKMFRGILGGRGLLANRAEFNARLDELERLTNTMLGIEVPTPREAVVSEGRKAKDATGRVLTLKEGQWIYDDTGEVYGGPS